MKADERPSVDLCDLCRLPLDEGDSCIQCRVYHGDPCFECENRGYHVWGCSRVEGFA